MSRLWLNSIVKNEEKIIERMLESVKVYVEGVVIADTGSTDSTMQKIKDWCASRGKKLYLKQIPFKNFSQARNEALDFARGIVASDDYLLLLDADMVFVGSDPLELETLTEEGYKLWQKHPGLEYVNTRLIRADSCARYAGPTHEYLGNPMWPILEGCYIKDVGDGGSKSSKWMRDRKLLEDFLIENPDDPRTLFFLGESCKNGGDKEKALEYYKKRIKVGGWDEETFMSMKAVAELTGITEDYLNTFQFRPHRHEALYKLAVSSREQGKHELACLLAEFLIRHREEGPGGDILFIEKEPYEYGPVRELSISGFYSNLKKNRDAGRRACLYLATKRGVSEHFSHEAGSNWVHYSKSAEELFLGTRRLQLHPQLEEGWHPCNPSVYADADGQMCINIRAVNYTIDEFGRYHMPDNIVRTRNFLYALDSEYKLTFVEAIVVDRPKAEGAKILGEEDIRLFADEYGRLWGSCTVVDNDLSNGDPRQMAVIKDNGDRWELVELIPNGGRAEKNWMIVPGPDLLTFVDRVDPMQLWERKEIKWGNFGCGPQGLVNLERECGSSQMLRWEDSWLCVTHTAVPGSNGKRVYRHRFVRFKDSFKATHVSEPFYFNEKFSIEFCCGMCRQKDSFVVSYGYEDKEAWLVVIPEAEVRRNMIPVSYFEGGFEL